MIIPFSYKETPRAATMMNPYSTPLSNANSMLLRAPNIRQRFYRDHPIRRVGGMGAQPQELEGPGAYVLIAIDKIAPLLTHRFFHIASARPKRCQQQRKQRAQCNCAADGVQHGRCG